ncbi:MAG: DUF5119 domain-containing protein [Tidjanibacter sp.]|nr:DUF5119 domain-containing protein [Tidjanibacter sp.]
MRLRRKIWSMVALLMVMLSAGCHRRPLEEMDDSLYLDLKLDLSVQNIEGGQLRKPELMRVLFYDAETLEFVSDDYVLPEGGYINALPGKYKMLVYNFDTESTIIRGDRNVGEIEAYTSEIPTSTRANLLTKLKAAATKPSFIAPDPEALIVYEPDHLLVAREDVEIVRRTGTQTLYADASSIVETYYLGVKLNNKGHLASAQALLSGQAKSNTFGFEGGVSKESVILYFDMFSGVNEKEGDVDVLQATFNTFGKLPEEVSHLWLTIVVTNTNGETVTWQKDITDEFNNNPDKYIYIEEPPIDVPIPPTPPSSGGGFQPTVGEWEEENYDIAI